MSEEPKVRLKPVVYTTNKFKSGAPEKTQQLFLLKAMQVTQDPSKLKQMLGLRSVAEVYRTLDKISMRKEYHEALGRQGISFDFIVEGIKDIAKTGFKDSDKLKAYQTLLKSVGLDRYEKETGVGAGTWEDALIKSIEKDKENSELASGKKLPEYTVSMPEVPESTKKKRELEKEITGSIYDSD